MSRAKKLAMFRRGAEAAAQVSGVEGLYFCPICKLGYEETAISVGLLTLEHVPPKSLGGRGVALTCKQCNNSAGHTVDAAVSRREELRRFQDLVLEAKGETTVDAVLEIADTKANVRVSRDIDGTTIIHLQERINDPQVVKRVSEYFERGATPSALAIDELTLTSKTKYHNRRALVSDLRTAYLAAFAALGYRYGFHPRLDIVREQILSPDSPIIHGWNLHINGAEKHDRAIAIVRDPPAVVVQYGTVGALLPWVAGPNDFYEHLRLTWSPNERLKLKGRRVAWPTHMVMALDLGVR